MYAPFVADTNDAAKAKRVKPRRELHRVCPRCGSAFKAALPQATYCSNACQKAHWRARSAERDGQRYRGRSGYSPEPRR